MPSDIAGIPDACSEGAQPPEPRIKLMKGKSKEERERGKEQEKSEKTDREGNVKKRDGLYSKLIVQP